MPDTDLHDSDELRPRAVATRRLGDVLLVSRGADRPVTRIGGTGVQLWEILAGGTSIGAATEAIADAFDAPCDLVGIHVRDFVASIVAADLATLAR